MNEIECNFLKPEFSRRALLQSAHKINPAFLSQAIDVSIDLEKNVQRPTKGLPGYFTYGWKKASDEIIRASDLGIEYISLRFVSTDVAKNDIDAGLSAFETTLSLIQNEIRQIPVKIIVDPFGLALTKKGQWGVQHKEGGFDREKTHTLLERIGYTLSVGGVHGVITLGRIPEEVRLTRKGIVEGGNRTKIYSFSQNSETSTAYIYLDSVDHNTGQKILPGNIKEMDLWSLIDIWHGTDVCVIKPMESYHLMSSLNYFIRDETARHTFLYSNAVEEMAMQHEFIYTTLMAIRNNLLQLSEKCARVKLAGYTISGTTYMLSLLARDKGIHMARARIEEMWLTALGAMDNNGVCLIDRNSSRFLEGSILC